MHLMTRHTTLPNQSPTTKMWDIVLDMRPHKEKTPKPSPMPSKEKKQINQKLRIYQSKGHNLART